MKNGKFRNLIKCPKTIPLFGKNFMTKNTSCRVVLNIEHIKPTNK